MNFRFTVAAAALALAAGSPALAKPAAERAAGEVVFHRCMACHSADGVKAAFGPSLIGIVGRKAGSLPEFDYSEAIRKSGIVWTEDNLRKWITSNDGFIPGTRMRHVAITDPAEQDYLLAYLKSLK